MSPATLQRQEASLPSTGSPVVDRVGDRIGSVVDLVVTGGIVVVLVRFDEIATVADVEFAVPIAALQRGADGDPAALKLDIGADEVLFPETVPLLVT